jgi:hypothetical protein
MMWKTRSNGNNAGVEHEGIYPTSDDQEIGRSNEHEFHMCRRYRICTNHADNICNSLIQKMAPRHGFELCVELSKILKSRNLLIL